MKRRVIENVMVFRIKKENSDKFKNTYRNMFNTVSETGYSFDKFMFDLSRDNYKYDVCATNYTDYLDYNMDNGVCGNVILTSNNKPTVSYVAINNILRDMHGEFTVFDLKSDECILALTVPTLMRAVNPKSLFAENKFGIIEELIIISNYNSNDNIREGAITSFKPDGKFGLITIDEANCLDDLNDKSPKELRLFDLIFTKLNPGEADIVLRFINHEICSNRTYHADFSYVTDFIDRYKADRFNNMEIMYIKYNKDLPGFSEMDKLRTEYIVGGTGTTIINEIMVGDFARFLGLHNMESVLRGFEMAVKVVSYSAFIC